MIFGIPLTGENSIMDWGLWILVIIVGAKLMKVSFKHILSDLLDLTEAFSSHRKSPVLKENIQMCIKEKE